MVQKYAARCSIQSEKSTHGNEYALIVNSEINMPVCACIDQSTNLGQGRNGESQDS